MKLLQFTAIVFCTIQGILGSCPPLRTRKGLGTKCVSPDGVTLLDCSNELPEGTKVYYDCEKFYSNPDGRSSGGRMLCNSEGQWLQFSDFKSFYCVSECGRTANASLNTVSSFIEREHETNEEVFPWHTIIFRRFGATNTFRYTCGGTLVNPDGNGFFILTAAHCVAKSPLTTEPGPTDNFKVVLGAVSTNFESNVLGASQIFSVKNIVIEREYDPESWQSNIAMIELNGPVKISDTVQPVCFPTRTIANSQVRLGVNGEIPVIKNDQLNYQEILRFPISEQGECMRDCAREPTITEFCAAHNTAARLNPLDSGTGLVFSEMIENSKMFYLQGILSKVAGEADGCASHDTFTSVSVFLDWVNRVHDDLADSQTKDVPYPHQTQPPPGNSIEDLPTNPPTNFEPNEILRLGLDLHNYYRRMHQSPPVQLNAKLSKEAQDWAEYLILENKWEFSLGKDYSENIFQYFGEISERDVMRKAVDNWYGALNKYNWNFPEANTFSQVVWRSTNEIGIGIAFSREGTKSVVVSNYWPKGNIYNVGDGDRGKYFKDNVFPIPAPQNTVSLV